MLSPKDREKLIAEEAKASGSGSTSSSATTKVRRRKNPQQL
jgi:hypothetical protein